MNQFIKIKNIFVNDLWIPVIKQAGSSFYPRLKKNKQMKFLTLTSDENYTEIDNLVTEKLSERLFTYPWNHTRLKMIRLESDGLDNVLGPTRYEDSIINTTHDIQNYFPFDIINLDFYSQNPLSQSGRFEKEIMSIDKTLFLQHSKGTKKSGFVLIYTSIVNGVAINCNTLRENSSKNGIEGWTYFSLSESGIVSDFNKKLQILESIIEQLALKYNYKLEKTIKKYDIIKNKKSICSLACIFRSNNK